MILIIALMPQMKEAFVGSSGNTNSTLQYPFEFCSDVSFIVTIFSRNCHLLFVLSLLISDLTFVFLLLPLLVFLQPDISEIFFRIVSENNYSHKNVLLIMKCIWRTNWITSGHEKPVCNETSHRRFFRMDKNYISRVRGWNVWYSETHCIKTLSGDSVIIRSNNNLMLET